MRRTFSWPSKLVEGGRAQILIRLDPARLANPDAELRYVLPDLLAARSGGAIQDDGYDYVGEPPFLVIFLRATAAEAAVARVIGVLEREDVLGNRLADAALVAISDANGADIVSDIGAVRIVYPPDHPGPFTPNGPD